MEIGKVLDQDGQQVLVKYGNNCVKGLSMPTVVIKKCLQQLKPQWSTKINRAKSDKRKTQQPYYFRIGIRG